MQFVLDLSDVKNDLVPEGMHPAVVEKVEIKQSAEGGSGFPYLNFRFKISEGEATGRVVFMKASLSPQAKFRLPAIFDALNLPTDKISFEYDDATNVVIEPPMAGKPVQVLVAHQANGGRTYAQVKDMFPIEGADGSTAAPRADTYV